jgi:hypothetical protein
MSTETKQFPTIGDGEPPIHGGSFNETERPSRGWSRKKTVAAGTAAAVAAGLVAFVAFRPKGGEEEQRVSTPVVAASSPNGQPGPSNIPTQSAENPNNPSAQPTTSSPEASSPNTPTPTETQTETTTTSIAEALTLEPSLYDPNAVKGLVMDQDRFDEYLNTFGKRYPEITTRFTEIASAQRAKLEALQPEELVAAQERFNNSLASLTYTDKSMKTREPEPISIGGYLTSGKYDGDTPFPQGIMSPADIKAHAQAFPGDPSVDGVSSTLVRRMVEASRLTTQQTWLSANNEAVYTYIRGMDKDQKETAKLVSPDKRMFYESRFIKQQDSNTTIQTLDLLSDTSIAWPSCSEGAVASVVNKQIPFGPDTVPLNGVIVTCEQPTTNELVVSSFVMLPVDSYLHGKKLNTKVAQPFIVSVDSVIGLS